jgi:S-adenosylmethionine hydrolase
MGGYTFIAPDNGLLSYVARDFGYWEWVELTNPAYRLPATSSTFHGRDIFAPAAAYLAAGVPLASFGRILKPAVMLPAPRLVMEPSRITGEVLHIDHFGSAVTSIGLLTWNTPEQLTLESRWSDAVPLTFAAQGAQVRAGATLISGIRHTYAEVERGAALALVGSSGYLELAVNSGSYRSLNIAAVGDPVEVQIG